MLAEEAKFRFFRLGIAVSNYSDGELMRMVAASLDKKDVNRPEFLGGCFV